MTEPPIAYGEPVDDDRVARAHRRLRAAIADATISGDRGPLVGDILVVLGPRHPCREITHIAGARVWVLDTVPREISPDGALICRPVSRCGE